MTRRFSRYSILMIIAATLLVSSFGVRSLAQATHTVTQVVVYAHPRTFSGPCPADIWFSSKVAASDYPVTITYEWERSDGFKGKREQRLLVDADGSPPSGMWVLRASG